MSRCPNHDTPYQLYYPLVNYRVDKYSDENYVIITLTTPGLLGKGYYLIWPNMQEYSRIEQLSSRIEQLSYKDKESYDDRIHYCPFEYMEIKDKSEYYKTSDLDN